MKFDLEIIAFTPNACKIAEENGATRIELCAGPSEGGTTPSYAFLKWSIENIGIPIFPMIRPRGGNFLYSIEEQNIIIDEIKICKQLGYAGIVTGALNANGTLPNEFLKKIIDTAYPMSVTFHRAFDRCAQPFDILFEIENLGFERILTSGTYANANDGKDVLKKLVKEAPSNLKILVGSGVRANNIIELANYIGNTEFHSSASLIIENNMQFKNANITEKLNHTSCDAIEVASMYKQLFEYFY